jgi:hypothetical protein
MGRLRRHATIARQSDRKLSRRLSIASKRSDARSSNGFANFESHPLRGGARRSRRGIESWRIAQKTRRPHFMLSEPAK